MKYQAYNPIDGCFEEYRTIEEARNYIKECILQDGAYDEELTGFKIFILHEVVSYTVVADKKDFTDEEWMDEGYSSDYEQIWQHHFNKAE